MRKATKIIISFAVILIAGLNFIFPAFAQDPFTSIAVGGLTGASGAGLFGSMASMSGINIGWSQSGSDPMDAMWNVLNPDHVYFSGEKHEADPQQDPEDIYDYIQVDIGDWLRAQRAFIDEFVTTYNVEDNDSGIISVFPSIYGYEFNITSGQFHYGDILGQSDVGNTVTLGPCSISFTSFSNNRLYYTSYYNGVVVQSSWIGSGAYQKNVRFSYHDGQANFLWFADGWGQIADTGVTKSELNPAETTNWTSEEVDTSVFDGWEAAKVKIPHSISQLTTGWTLPDFLNELDRIWSGAGEDNIIIEDGGYVPPVPPTPIPTIPLGEVPFDDWIDLWGQGIYQQLENQSDALDFIGSAGEDAIEELESIDTNLEDIAETAESIDTNIGVGNGILGGIKSLAQSAVNYLEGIAEHVGEIVEEIVEGTETLIAGILNQIPQVFGVIFGPIKQASSIWHYVVEWIQSIGAPFQFIWSMASGTSYYIILPVYASLAASVVLAFYKRFGK